MQEIKGIIVPILTPMNEDESINLPELRNQIERMIAAGVHGIFPLAPTVKAISSPKARRKQC